MPSAPPGSSAPNPGHFSPRNQPVALSAHSEPPIGSTYIHGRHTELCDLSDRSEPPSALQIRSPASYTKDALVSPRTPDGAHRFHSFFADCVCRNICRRRAHRCLANARACLHQQVDGASRTSAPDLAFFDRKACCSWCNTGARFANHTSPRPSLRIFVRTPCHILNEPFGDASAYPLQSLSLQGTLRSSGHRSRLCLEAGIW